MASAGDPSVHATNARATITSARNRSRLTSRRRRSKRSATTPPNGLRKTYPSMRATAETATQPAEPVASYSTTTSATKYRKSPVIDTA
jgi:hypothetical protein